MKHVLHCILVCLVSLMAFSCLSTPVTPADTPAAVVSPQESVEAGEPVAAEQAADATTADAATTEPVTPEEGTSWVADTLPNEIVQTSGAVPADTTPMVADEEPSIPAGERLLYFYPEPDPLYVVPAPKAAEKPAAVPAPKQPEKKVEQVKPAESKPAEKIASEPDPEAAKEKTSEPIPGIWPVEPVAPPVTTVKPAAAVAPSRKVSLSQGQTLEVWYPGSGWVYLGDVSAQNGLGYETRKLDKADTLFTFKALKAGNYILEFTRFDVLEDSFSSDTVAVSVAETDSKKGGKVRAPDYRSAAASSSLAPAQAATGPVSSGGTVSSGISDEPSLLSGTAIPVTGDTSRAAVPDAAALLEKAKASLAAGDAAAALASLETFFSAAVESLDEGWFLRGQAYEANSAVRDIRKALDAYKTLVDAWPESGRWVEADSRIRYIKQFYLGR